MSAGVLQELTLSTVTYDSNMVLSITEEVNGKEIVLHTGVLAPLMSDGGAQLSTISILPQTSNVKVKIGPAYILTPGTAVAVEGYWKRVTTPYQEQEQILVTLCDTVGDQYRFGFNGQERTDEVYGVGNLNTALFWEYDTRLGRRWNVDPMDQISISNYAVNGLNPIYYLDPKGDFRTKFGAKVYNFLHGGKGEIIKATGGYKKGEWFVGKQVEYKDQGAGIAYQRKFGWDEGNPANVIDAIVDGANKGVDFAKRNASDAWNSPIARYYIPDYYTLSASFQTASGAYVNEEFTFTLMLRGKDPGLYVNTTTGFGGVTSFGVDVGYSIGKGYYIGDARKLSSSMLGGWQGSASVGFGLKEVVGASINGGIDVGFDDNGKPSTISGKIGISAGVGASTPVLQGSIGTGKATNAIPIFKF